MRESDDGDHPCVYMEIFELIVVRMSSMCDDDDHMVICVSFF